MGEFADAATAVLSDQTDQSETPINTADVGDAIGVETSTDDTPASDPAASAEVATDAPPVAAPQPTAATRDDRGRFAGQRPGPPSTVPYGRFQEVTKTAKQRGDEIAAMKERFGWIGDHEAPVFKQFWEAYKANPAEAFLNELPLLLNSPRYGARMRHALSEMIGPQATAAVTATAEVDDEEPKPDFYQQAEDGTRTYFYSADQQAKHRAWQAKQQEKSLAPIKEFVEQAKLERVATRMTAEAKHSAKALMAPLVASPYFEPHREAIRTKFRQYAKTMDGSAALHRAYADVLQEVVIPSLSNADRRALASSLQAKTGASSPNPARPGAVSGASKPPTTFGEAAARILGATG